MKTFAKIWLFSPWANVWWNMAAMVEWKIHYPCLLAIWLIYKFMMKRNKPWWRHPMERFSALLVLFAGTHRSPVNSPHKGQWRGAFMFSLICVWINGWVNNRDAGDLKRYCAHYDDTALTLDYIKWTVPIIDNGSQWWYMREANMMDSMSIKFKRDNAIYSESWLTHNQIFASCLLIRIGHLPAHLFAFLSSMH